METPPPLADDLRHSTKDLALTSSLKPDNLATSVVTLEPYVTEVSKKEKFVTSPILYVKGLPFDWSFDIIFEEFGKFGLIKEIGKKLDDKFQGFETWIMFLKPEDALRACKDFNIAGLHVKCTLVKTFPQNLDIYKPPNQTEDIEHRTSVLRSPNPPRWVIITTIDNQRGNLFKIKKYINQRLGHVNRPEITRFGRNSFLVHTNSDGQAVMLLNLRLESDGLIKEIKPHFNFSYAKGVIFNEDIHELDEEEILDMCPLEVWKVFKVPRSSMIILTFINPVVPAEVVLESEIVRVRPYKPRVLQCFKCFGFGHSSRVCTRVQLCEFCSLPEHGECTKPKICVNCKGSHHARDKNCVEFKKEQEALIKSMDEHISIGHAKKLLAKKNSYSDVVKRIQPNALDHDTISVRSSNGEATKASSTVQRHFSIPLLGLPRTLLLRILEPPLVGLIGLPLAELPSPLWSGLRKPPLLGLLKILTLGLRGLLLQFPKGLLI